MGIGVIRISIHDHKLVDILRSSRVHDQAEPELFSLLDAGTIPRQMIGSIPRVGHEPFRWGSQNESTGAAREDGKYRVIRPPFSVLAPGWLSLLSGWSKVMLTKGAGGESVFQSYPFFLFAAFSLFLKKESKIKHHFFVFVVFVFRLTAPIYFCVFFFPPSPECDIFSFILFLFFKRRNERN